MTYGDDETRDGTAGTASISTGDADTRDGRDTRSGARRREAADSPAGSEPARRRRSLSDSSDCNCDASAPPLRLAPAIGKRQSTLMGVKAPVPPPTPPRHARPPAPGVQAGARFAVGVIARRPPLLRAGVSPSRKAGHGLPGIGGST